MTMTSEVTSSVSVEITPVWGGYIYTMAVPTDLADGTDLDDVYEYKVSVSSDIDVMLAHVRKHLTETQNYWRRENLGEPPVVDAAQKSKPSRRTIDKGHRRDDDSDGDDDDSGSRVEA